MLLAVFVTTVRSMLLRLPTSNDQATNNGRWT